MLDELVQQYRDRTVRDMHINVYRALENVSLDGMVYAGSTGHDTTKECSDGTRTEILREIVDWTHDSDVNAPQIFWLHGQGKIGHRPHHCIVVQEFRWTWIVLLLCA